MTKKTAIARATSLLDILRNVYEDDAMPSMIDEGDAEERIEQIDDVIAVLRKK
jgi:hypothetical protein